MDKKFTDGQNAILNAIGADLGSVLLANSIVHGRLPMYIALTEIFVQTSVAMAIPKDELLNNIEHMFDIVAGAAEKNHQQELETDPLLN